MKNYALAVIFKSRLVQVLIFTIAFGVNAWSQNITVSQPVLRNFVGKTDADKDGYFEEYTFQLVFTIYNHSLQRVPVFVDILFEPPGKHSINGPWTLDTAGSIFGIPLFPSQLEVTLSGDQDVVRSFLKGNTAIISKLLILDQSKTKGFGGRITALGGAIKADPIPTVRIGGIEKSKQSSVDWRDQISYELKVVDADGKPVAGARVEGTDGLMSAPVRTTPQTTGSAGEISYEARVPEGATNGSYALTFQALKAGFTNTSPVTNYVSVIHSTRFGGEIRLDTAGRRLLPGLELPMELVIENRGTNQARDSLTLSFVLSASKERGPQDVILLMSFLSVDLAPGKSHAWQERVILKEGPMPPLDRNGPRRLHLVISSEPGGPGSGVVTNVISSDCFWFGEVLNVVTHGFIPEVFGDFFLRDTTSVAQKLDGVPEAGSLLKDRVRSYVHPWNSSKGFLSALSEFTVATLLETLAQKVRKGGQEDLADWMLDRAMSLKAKAEKSAKTVSGPIAAGAAQAISGILKREYLLKEPSLSSRFQMIHLVGHSRGAAVNARLSKILDDSGYLVDQFTSLDGFSDDWGADVKLIADISIVGEAVARRKVNYRVQEPLAAGIADDFGTAVIVSHPLIVAMSQFAAATVSKELRQQLAQLPLLAPERKGKGFEDTVIAGGLKPSNHFNVVPLYGSTPSFLYDNFVGKHRSLSDCSPDSWDAGLSRRSLHQFSSMNTEASAESLQTETVRDFVDGSLEYLGRLLNEQKAIQTNSTGDAFLDAFLRATFAPTNLLASTWTVEGNVSVVTSPTNTAVRLSGREAAGLGQYVMLSPGGSSLSFSTSLNGLGPASAIQIRFGDIVLTNLSLAAAGNGLIDFRIPLLGTQGNGLLSLVLVGNDLEGGSVVVDDIKLTSLSARFVEWSQPNAGTLRIVFAGVSGTEYALEESTDLIIWTQVSITLAKDNPTALTVPVTSGGKRFYRMRLLNAPEAQPKRVQNR